VSHWITICDHADIGGMSCSVLASAPVPVPGYWSHAPGVRSRGGPDPYCRMLTSGGSRVRGHGGAVRALGSWVALPAGTAPRARGLCRQRAACQDLVRGRARRRTWGPPPHRPGP